MDSGKNEKEHFIKQQRNLIAIALFIIFYETANLKITQINILGNHTDIGNPAIISQTVAIAFLYFLWRYFTACREVSGISKFQYACLGWAEKKAKIKITKQQLLKINNIESISVALTDRSNFLQRTFTLDYNEHGKRTELKTKNINTKWLFRLYVLLSIIPITLTTSFFSEYVLPYFISIIALWLAIPMIF